ncbi:hypothetical protein AAFF_G00185290 [Aldrovandia affinis]|uniref:Ammonium transporter AmtB-like domain-containing protein n=1 Tax=Aldrovandia affinis TaxID=143900 RepID=A0AAD7W6V1_9TELE|nr:hypothetical protein AAFF_G00185290 [Aldrovandia affinis]
MMAPKYAPSLRGRLPPMALILETIFILLFAFLVEYEAPGIIEKNPVTNIYAEFQDVNVMVFLGFGFLATFLVRYSFSGAAFTLLVASLAVQWAVLMNGLLFTFHKGKIHIGMNSLVTANLCAVSALIGMGAVLGKTNPAHLILMALLEVTGFTVNSWILQTFFKVQPVDAIMLLHIFGACFGLTMSWILFRSGLEPRHEKEGSDRTTGLFSAMGALFLWMFWPSFNSVLIGQSFLEQKLRAIYSTYLSLATSAVTAFAVSVVTSPQGKINKVHIQNASLAGGVAVGVAASAVDVPWVAMAIGLCAGLISTLGLRHMKPHLQFVFKCHDTCGVLSIHGMPGILGWAAYLLIQVARSPDITVALNFAMYHLCTLMVTLSMSLSLGAVTGIFVKWNVWRPPQDRKFFDDQAFWEFPHLAERK